jgi:hypothetical protein
MLARPKQEAADASFIYYSGQLAVRVCSVQAVRLLRLLSAGAQ